jgi:hypothetical protein
VFFDRPSDQFGNPALLRVCRFAELLLAQFGKTGLPDCQALFYQALTADENYRFPVRQRGPEPNWNRRTENSPQNCAEITVNRKEFWAWI